LWLIERRTPAQKRYSFHSISCEKKTENEEAESLRNLYGPGATFYGLFIDFVGSEEAYLHPLKMSPGLKENLDVRSANISGSAGSRFRSRCNAAQEHKLKETLCLSDSFAAQLS